MILVARESEPAAAASATAIVFILNLGRNSCQ